MKAVILIAGIGSRLGSPFPKCMQRLPYGETILERQVRIFREIEIDGIVGVLGFKKELIMEHMSGIYYRYNPVYYHTNTSKSLLAGLEYFNDDILWVNGDVIFERKLAKKLTKNDGLNKVAVDTKSCSDEEVKYKIDDGKICSISKGVKDADGEAVGINIIRKNSLNSFKNKLRECDDKDYFEKAIEMMIEDGECFYPCFIENKKCIEVDFIEDWEDACRMFRSES